MDQFSISILSGISIFIVLLVIHILGWNIFKPRNHISILFIIFLVIPTFTFAGFMVFELKVVTANQAFLTFLLYISLACAYIQTYPAAQANAPSLQIIYFMYKVNKPVSEQEIAKNFNNENLVQERIDDLLEEGFIQQQDEKLYLTGKGKLLSDIFYFYRKLYGLKRGEG